ncbi:MAG TPA: hypothetical protein VFD88_04640 [Clostridia bacterium]|nr:hypothetical protein [Clostridia bacterium]
MLSPPVPAGMAAFVRWTHLLRVFFLVIIVRSGLQENRAAHRAPLSGRPAWLGQK